MVVRDVEHVEAGASQDVRPRGRAAEGEAAVSPGALRRAARRQRSLEVGDDEIASAQIAADAVEDARIGVAGERDVASPDERERSRHCIVRGDACRRRQLAACGRRAAEEENGYESEEQDAAGVTHRLQTRTG